MSFFIQHGHGKSDKIDTALTEGTTNGVVFAARNELPEKLVKYLEAVQKEHEDAELLFDPQFYVTTLTPPNDRFLPKYPYYTAGLTAADFTGSKKIAKHVKATLDYQKELGLDALISPTVTFDSFNDRWHQIALNLADASLDYYEEMEGAPPLLLNFVVSEDALGAREDLDRFLDTVTQDGWNMDGFYFIVARNESMYNQRFESGKLAHLLYASYVLGSINGLRVLFGYSDFVGILLRAAGTEVFCSGWSQSLRQFHLKNLLKRKPGGQPALERYSSSKLLNSIYLGELQDIYDAGYLDDVLSDVPADAPLKAASSPQGSGWTTIHSQQHHWQTLRTMDDSLSGEVRKDARTLTRQLREADGLYRMLEAEGVQFNRFTGKDHLMEWVAALSEFQKMAGLAPS